MNLPPAINRLYPAIEIHAARFTEVIEDIPNARKNLIGDLAHFISRKVNKGEGAHLNFICTHNSRRSHMAQLWTAALAWRLGLQYNIATYSGGTETTAFNPAAVHALRMVGFEIIRSEEPINPQYEIGFGPDAKTLKAYSKLYNAAENPKSEFIAVMTCSDADEACPMVVGAEKRYALTYDDPKVSDGTPLQEETYYERCCQIGAEITLMMLLIHEQTAFS